MTDTKKMPVRRKHLDLSAGHIVEFENPFGGTKALKHADRGYTGDQGITVTAVLAPWWLSPRFPRHATEAAPATIPLDKQGHPSPASCDLYPTQLVLSLF